MTTATKYKTYPKYKSSGIDWLGYVPEGWEVKKLKFGADIVMGQSPDSEDYEDEESGIPFLQGNAEFTEDYPIPKLWCQTTNKISRIGDILLSVRAPVGAINISDQKYGIGRGLCAVHGTLFYQKYLTYLLNICNEYLNILATGSTFTAISVDDVKSLVLPLPAFEIQQVIAIFLDRETAKIDEMVEKKQKMMEILKEKRQVLITHAVTKGLDLKAKMKPSGIDWLGDIPEGWEVKRLRFVIKTNPTKQENKASAPDSEVSFIPMEAVSENGEIDLSTKKTLKEVIDGYTYFRDGDVVIAKITPCFENGKGAIMHGLTNGVGFGTTEFHVLRSADIDSKFLYLITRIYPFRAFGEVNMKGAAGQKRVPEEFIKDFSLGLPKVSEQKTIAGFLDHETTKIDEVMVKIETQIEKLQEYRQALITSAVTGKIMVN